MRDFAISLLLFGFSTFIVILLSDISVPMRVTVQVIAVLLVLILIIISFFYHTLTRSFSKLLLLFLTTLTVQLLVISTGGLYSPYLILFHLLALGIGLIYSLSKSLIFLSLSIILIILSLLTDAKAMIMLLQDPAAALLYGISFISVVPLGQLLAQRYKVKEAIMTLMSDQIEVHESIISELSELVFVTDKNGSILAVNEAVEHTLGKSSAAILHHHLFDELLLRDKDNTLLNEKKLDLEKIANEKKTLSFSGLSLLGNAISNNNKVSIRIKPVTGLKGTVDQISFIIGASDQSGDEVYKNLEEASARVNAKYGVLKSQLAAVTQTGLHQLVLIEKSEKDILIARTIEDHSITEKKILIDIAVLCKAMVNEKQDFSKALGVPLQFAIFDFGEKDIAPLITSQFDIKPEDFTGPFFTAPCEVRYFNIAVQKLIEVGILLASSEQEPFVTVSVERKGEKSIIISISANIPQNVLQDKADLFVMYYGTLAGKTNISQGSGLEGYLAKKILDALNIPLIVTMDEDKSGLIFQLNINKEKK